MGVGPAVLVCGGRGGIEHLQAGGVERLLYHDNYLQCGASILHHIGGLHKFWDGLAYTKYSGEPTHQDFTTQLFSQRIYKICHF